MAAVDLLKGFEFSCATNSLGGTTIGKVQSLSFGINNNMVAFYAAGNRVVNTIKEGNLAMTGSLTQALRDKTELIDIVYQGSGATLQTSDNLYIRGSTGITATETVDLTLTLKWDNWSFSYANDGNEVFETATFIASALTVAEITN